MKDRRTKVARFKIQEYAQNHDRLDRLRNGDAAVPLNLQVQQQPCPWLIPTGKIFPHTLVHSCKKYGHPQSCSFRIKSVVVGTGSVGISGRRTCWESPCAFVCQELQTFPEPNDYPLSRNIWLRTRMAPLEPCSRPPLGMLPNC